ncbi:MAG: four helix bundle protein [Chloroflexi bacterium]|nr:four helix bundle protein [Chloroflexota bacterium]
MTLLQRQKFEDLEIWQLGRQIVPVVYKLTRNCSFSRDVSLARQMQRSAVSVVSNIAEGFERRSNKEFANFLYMAKGSCGELRSQLWLTLDLGYVSRDEFQKAYEAAETISRSLAGFIKYVQTTAWK